MRKNKVLLVFVLVCIHLSFSSCKKEENSEFTDLPIIEGYLTPDSYFQVSISRQIPFINDATYSNDDISNLTIYLDYNGSTHVLTALGDGNYVDSTIIVKEADQYKLSFEFNSKSVSATTYTPSSPTGFTQSVTTIAVPRLENNGGIPSGGMPTEPDPVELHWNNSDNSYYLVVVENTESVLDPIRDFGDETPPGNIFRKSPTKSSDEILKSFDFQYFGMHRIILFHVLPDYASLYDDNSSSSQNLSNPSTSIVNGYGIFTGMNSDTLYINVTEQ